MSDSRTGEQRRPWWRWWTRSARAAVGDGDLAAENARLRRAVAELSMVNDVAREIAGSLDSQQIVDTILHRARKAVGAEQAAIVLVDRDQDDQPRTLVRSVTWRGEATIWHLDQRLLGWMAAHHRPLLSNDPAQDPEVAFAAVPDHVRHLLCVPMQVGGDLVGVLTAVNKRDGNGFDEADARLLTIIASQSAQVVEAARLLERERTLAEVEQELQAARRIQRHLLPTVMPTIDGYDVAADLRTAGAVGGDVYDIVDLGAGRWAFAMLDVSGHGVPAALLAANVHASLRSRLANGLSPAACLAELDRHLRTVAEHGDFATCFLGVLEAGRAEFTYAVGGHEPGVWWRRAGGESRLLANGDPLLGVVPDPVYTEASINLAPGDRIILYTDGVTDRFDASGQRFGRERLSVLAGTNGSAAEALAAILASVDRYGHGDQDDDQALIIIQRDTISDEERP